MRPKKQTITTKQPLSRDSAGTRFAILASLGEIVFHARDLANLWNINNTRTLYITLSRYVKSGLLYRVYKGMYAIKSPDTISPYLLGVKAIHAPAYISCESILFEHGFINQLPSQITLVSSVSKQFKIGQQYFHSRKLNDRFLFNDAGIEWHDGIRIASPSRAVADMLYFHPTKYFDALHLIDWQEVKTLAREIGYTISVPKNI